MTRKQGYGPLSSEIIRPEVIIRIDWKGKDPHDIDCGEKYISTTYMYHTTIPGTLVGMIYQQIQARSRDGRTSTGDVSRQSRAR